jgi:hypothetical protein
VYALAAKPDGESGTDLYAGGYFHTAGGKPSDFIARWSEHIPSIPLSTGWNLVSIPYIVSNDSVDVLFPGGISTAFAYSSGSYESRLTMKHGLGYWLKYPSPSSVVITGTPTISDTIPVTAGWNLIGSISTPIATSSLTSIPPGMTTSGFFGYGGSYYAINTIEPGSGYWVNVSEDGQLILSSSSSVPSNRIKIVPTSELPPSSPEAPIPNLQSPTPNRFALEQNYPNPFNPATTIRYALLVQSHVTLKIFNVLGQEVALLVDEIQDAGFKSVHWDASKFASGMYFYKLSAGPYVEVKKMLIVQ